MVTTAANFSDPRHSGYDYSGVVRISYNGRFGTGVLLYDGKSILTCAHLFPNNLTNASISFLTEANPIYYQSNNFSLNPNYDAINNNDLAIVSLTANAPTLALRYDIYRKKNEISKQFTIVGYGLNGTGNSGYASNSESSNIRYKAINTFDADAFELKANLGSSINWTPLPGTQLLADFDNQIATNDALGNLINKNDLGVGINEGFIAPGDSGGPAFIDAKVAGIASYTTSLSNSLISPDVDSLSNSSFGEIGSWQRISTYQEWIDKTIRGNYKNAPSKPADVKVEISEGNEGLSFAYFLLTFEGIRANEGDILSVEYSTRDGSANAGIDYLAVSGKLNLYPGENTAVIPIEVIGDTQSEQNETFYLDVFNPIGGKFSGNATTLSAMRTILNDDAKPFI